MASHPLTLLHCTDVQSGFQSSVDKGLENISGSDHIRDHKGSQRKIRRSSKTKIDDAMMFHHQKLISFDSCTMLYTPNSKFFRSETKVKLTQLQS